MHTKYGTKSGQVNSIFQRLGVDEYSLFKQSIPRVHLNLSFFSFQDMASKLLIKFKIESEKTADTCLKLLDHSRYRTHDKP